MRSLFAPWRLGRFSLVAFEVLSSLVLGCDSGPSGAGTAHQGAIVDAALLEGRAPGDDGDAANASFDSDRDEMASAEAADAQDAFVDADHGPARDADGVAIGDATGVLAIAATRFLESIGVCTHVGQGVDAPASSATAIAFAGIRNLRDDGNAAHVSDWISMHQSSGVRVCLLTNQDVASTLAIAEQLNVAGALMAVEGPNEPNNFPVTYQGQTASYQTTFAPVAKLQRDLFAAVKADAKLSGIPVFHSSEAGGAEPDDVGLQFLKIPSGSGVGMPDGTQYADYANTHNYVCGHSSKLVDNVAWNASDPTLNGDWDGPYVEYGHTWHGGFAGYSNADLMTLPRVTTETAG
jgi:hypothetical protein